MELHTGAFAESKVLSKRREEIERMEAAAKSACKLGLGVHAGHGIDYQNVLWIRNIPEIEELSIGHSVMARATLVGIERAVGEMIALLNGQ